MHPVPGVTLVASFTYPVGRHPGIDIVTSSDARITFRAPGFHLEVSRSVLDASGSRHAGWPDLESPVEVVMDRSFSVAINFW